MMRRASDVLCVFQIHFARLRTEVGAFLLVALVFPSVMYMFANAVGGDGAAALDPQHRVRFLAGSIVFSLSLTAVSWLASRTTEAIMWWRRALSKRPVTNNPVGCVPTSSRRKKSLEESSRPVLGSTTMSLPA